MCVGPIQFLPTNLSFLQMAEDTSSQMPPPENQQTDTWECCICYEDGRTTAQMMLACRHNICLSCYTSMNNTASSNTNSIKCPMCRQRIQKTNGQPCVSADGPRPSVFTKPTAISNELCEFLNIPPYSCVSRSNVTKYICNYARDNGLLDKQKICGDERLFKLFPTLRDNNDLKILNLQKYLKPHYTPLPPSTYDEYS